MASGVSVGLPLPRRGLGGCHQYTPKQVVFMPGGKGPATVQRCCRRFRKFPGVDDIVTKADVPGMAQIGSNNDQPLFCMDHKSGQVTAHGQVLCLVLADTEVTAEDAAQFLSTRCVRYAPHEPIWTIGQARTAGSIFIDCPNKDGSGPQHIWKITRPGTQDHWVNAAGSPARVTLNGIQCRVVQGEQQTGGQIHFYMETQTCFAHPREQMHLVLHPVTIAGLDTKLRRPGAERSQPDLADEMNLDKVDVRIKRIGGDMAVSAPSRCSRRRGWPRGSRRPVRLTSMRAVDTSVFGHRQR